MAKVPRPAPNSDYPPLPEYTPLIGRVVEKPTESVSDRFKDANGEPKTQIRIIFEIEDPPQYAAAKCRVWATHSKSLGEMPSGETSHLRQLFQAVHDHDLTKDELYDVDIDDLEGRRCIIIGKYGPNDTERRYLKVEKYARLPGGTKQQPVEAPASASARTVPATASSDQASDLDLDF